MIKNIYKFIDSFFDKLEDVTRSKLSKHSFIYAFIGGSCIIIFWRGVWHSADYLQQNTYIGSIVFSNLGSIIFAVVALLLSGLFVSIFIGESILMSGLKHEKKVSEKTEAEVTAERADIEIIKENINDIRSKLERIEELNKDRKNSL